MVLIADGLDQRATAEPVRVLSTISPGHPVIVMTGRTVAVGAGMMVCMHYSVEICVEQKLFVQVTASC